jgi:hypothetical protein
MNLLLPPCLHQHDPADRDAKLPIIARDARLLGGGGAGTYSHGTRPCRQAKCVVVAAPLDRIDTPSIDYEMQIWIIRQQRWPVRPNPTLQSAPDVVHVSPTRHDRRARWLRRSQPAIAGILEQPTISVVAITLGRSTIGQENIVAIQLDVVQRHLLRVIIPENRVVVDEVLHRYQHVVEKEGMPFRDAEIAIGDVVGECAFAHDDGRRRAAAAARGENPPDTDPGNALDRAVGGKNGIADRQMLDRQLATRRGDARAGEEAEVTGTTETSSTPMKELPLPLAAKGDRGGCRGGCLDKAVGVAGTEAQQSGLSAVPATCMTVLPFPNASNALAPSPSLL